MAVNESQAVSTVTCYCISHGTDIPHNTVIHERWGEKVLDAERYGLIEQQI